MRKPPRRELPLVGMMAVFVVLCLLAGIGLVSPGWAVIGLGSSSLGLAIRGKPEWGGFGLTELLLHRLPEPAWRVVMTVLGLSIIGLGIAGLVTGD